jgi:hypothetical protein
MAAHVFCVSAGRSQAVRPMQELLRPLSVNWMVRPRDVGPYRKAGAHAVHTQTGEGVANARNSVLDVVRRRPHFQLSDDLKGIKRLVQGKGQDIAVVVALEEMLDALEWSDFKLCGVAPTNNAFFARERNSTNLFILGDLMLIKPSHLRFDEELPLKEDYDYTLQHHAAFGGALRLDWLMPTFTHRTNKGGAVDTRTAAVEQQAIRRIMDKWPGKVRPNPRRENEILLVPPKRTREVL